MKLCKYFFIYYNNYLRIDNEHNKRVILTTNFLLFLNLISGFIRAFISS